MGWRVLRLFVLVLGVGVFVRSAWASDDAFIAFRAMDNFTHGHGLVSNVGERVQAFTSPLWLLLLTPLHRLTNEAFFTPIGLSLILSTVVAALLVFKVPVRPVDGLVIGLMIPFSRALVDYATSGLENPLMHCLAVLFLIVYFRAGATRRAAFGLSLVAGLLFLTRMDTLLITALPLLHYAVWTRRNKLLPHMALGLLPVFAWEAFSVLYYGFPFPNTAYAKLNVDIATGTVVVQGLGYLQDSLARDPLTLVVIVFALVASVASRNLRAFAPMLGVLLYLVYLVKIGGDFMSGRFLTVPFVVALAVLAAWILPALPTRWSQGVAAVAALIVLSAPSNPVRAVVEPCSIPDHGITDERSCYYDSNGLLRNAHRSDKGWTYQQQKYWQAGVKKKEGAETVYEDSLIGFTGFAAGPRIHLVDPAALTDPLLARIPFSKPNWRIGHFYRDVPKGYLETLRTGENQIESPCLRQYYDQLSLVLRGPIFSFRRFKAILALNFGSYDRLLAPSCDPPSS